MPTPVVIEHAPLAAGSKAGFGRGRRRALGLAERLRHPGVIEPG